MREQDNPACRDQFQAAYNLLGRIGDRPAQAAAAFSLGNAYLGVPGLRDLDQAHHWHQRSLDLTPEQDRIGRAATRNSLGAVAYERFHEARAAGAPTAQLAAHLVQAYASHKHALILLPIDQHEIRAIAHNQLGNIYSEVGDVPQALGHYLQSVRHEEARGYTYGAGRARSNIALLLRANGRPGDALHYARAALANFQQVGTGAAEAAAQAQALIQDVEREVAP